MPPAMSPAFQNIGGARALAIGLAPSFTSIALLPPHLLSFLPSPPPPSLPSSNGVSRCHRRLSGRRAREKKRPAWLCLRPPGRSLAAAAAEDVGQPSLHHLALGKREGGGGAGGRPVTAESMSPFQILLQMLKIALIKVSWIKNIH